MSARDGGPALVGLEIADGVVRLSSQMTLRDYFATAELAKKDDVPTLADPELYDRLARHCYRMADAMLKAREAQP